MNKKIIVILTIFLLLVSSISFANSLLGDNWEYVGQKVYGGNMPNARVYCDRNTLQWLDNGNLRVCVCLYFPPSVYNKNGLYGFYDDEISGKEGLFCIYRTGEFVNQNGVLNINYIDNPHVVWNAFTPYSIYQHIYNSYLNLR